MSSRHVGIGMTSQRTRQRMVQRLREQGIADERVLGALSEVPRHIFVDEALAHRAYEDISLPLGFGQTISSPWVVARMLELARDGRGLTKVLEIGTGCGYQAAILSKLAREVYSVERLPELLMRARRNLRELRITNVRMKLADGHLGLNDSAPYDAIVMAAAATHVPDALLEQLEVGGRLVMPLGIREQLLTLITRTAEGYDRRSLEPVRFVPLVPGATM
jgi:protein-L-isoaspartate(D-aspartate) O-methyltransferase